MSRLGTNQVRLVAAYRVTLLRGAIAKYPQSIQKASNAPESAFYAHVTIETHAAPNLIITSAPYEACTLALNEITSTQRGTIQEATAYLEPLPGTSRGVITELDPNPTNEQLPYILSANGQRILHARMFRILTTALITFEGVHVPFSIKLYCLLVVALTNKPDSVVNSAVNLESDEMSAPIPTSPSASDATCLTPKQNRSADSRVTSGG
ncbi:hypothetical protein HPB48_014526 [Haemaphysalis longicornis]|uniref:Uncharacterized protein n=1 Tax=Haemaphysalis longicornis TaxID=44386 RepID=A0A9J6H0Z4_HAELO|nr:hypothetical protein HPB48_014526 [Haemaphysalis longicornis]